MSTSSSTAPPNDDAISTTASANTTDTTTASANTTDSTTPPPAKTEQSDWQRSSSSFESKHYSEYFDPCQEAANRSLKCLRRNGGDRMMCQDYFDAYKACKKSWMNERAEQKRSEGKGWFG